jgi:hypothetical protein
MGPHVQGRRSGAVNVASGWSCCARLASRQAAGHTYKGGIPASSPRLASLLGSSLLLLPPAGHHLPLLPLPRLSPSFFFVFSYYTLRRSSSATASSAAEKRLPLRAPLPPFHLLPRDSPPFRLVCRVQIVKVSDPPFSIILLPWQTQAMNRPAAPVASTAVLSPSHRWVAPYHHSTPISWVSTF